MTSLSSTTDDSDPRRHAACWKVCKRVALQFKVDTAGTDGWIKPTHHICQSIKNTLPRMKHVRLNLGRLCECILLKDQKQVPSTTSRVTAECTVAPLLETLRCGPALFPKPPRSASFNGQTLVICLGFIPFDLVFRTTRSVCIQAALLWTAKVF